MPFHVRLLSPGLAITHINYITFLTTRKPAAIAAGWFHCLEADIRDTRLL
jgi:hypothetical protein